jgi:hypothetical protein
MTWSAMQLMRVAFLLLLFQFVAPAFLPVTTQGFDSDQKSVVTLHTEHTSILIPILLKEKEEKEELDDRANDLKLLPLIDFTDHSQVLTELHEFKHHFIPVGQQYDHEPPLFTLHCTFTI